MNLVWRSVLFQRKLESWRFGELNETEMRSIGRHIESLSEMQSKGNLISIWWWKGADLVTKSVVPYRTRTVEKQKHVGGFWGSTFWSSTTCDEETNRGQVPSRSSRCQSDDWRLCWRRVQQTAENVQNEGKSRTDRRMAWWEPYRNRRVWLREAAALLSRRKPVDRKSDKEKQKKRTTLLGSRSRFATITQSAQTGIIPRSG